MRNDGCVLRGGGDFVLGYVILFGREGKKQGWAGGNSFVCIYSSR